PNTRSGIVSVPTGSSYSRTRLLPPSTMYTLPTASVPTSVGDNRDVAVVLPPPNILLAVPLVSGVSYSKARLSEYATTYNRPAASIVKPLGVHTESSEGPEQPFDVKLPDWPNTRFAVVFPVSGAS